MAFDQTGSAPDAATASFRGPFDNPHHSLSFKTTLDTYAEKVRAIDPEMKLCITEFGWVSSEGYDASPEGFGFAADNTLEEQATYIVDAYQQMRESGYVWLTFLFNFDYGNKSGGPSNDNVPYSTIDVNGVPRPLSARSARWKRRRKEMRPLRWPALALALLSSSDCCLRWRGRKQPLPRHRYLPRLRAPGVPLRGRGQPATRQLPRTSRQRRRPNPRRRLTTRSTRQSMASRLSSSGSQIWPATGLRWSGRWVSAG